MKVLQEQLTTLATKQQMAALEMKVFPMLKVCTMELGCFKADNKDMKKAISKFDESMLLKADRFSLEMNKKWCEQTFLPANTIDELRTDFLGNIEK